MVNRPASTKSGKGISLVAYRNFTRVARAVSRRFRHWRESRTSYHANQSDVAQRSGKRLLLDLDWYGFSNFDFARVLDACPELKERIHVQKVPRDAVFRFHGTPPLKVDGAADWETLRGLTHRGIKLWEVSKVSFLKEYGQRIRPPFDVASLQRLLQFYGWAVACIDGVERLLDVTRPDMINVFQGGHLDSRCAVECANKRCIRTIAVETSFIGDHALVDGLCGMIVNRHSLARLGRTLYEAATLPELDPVAFWKESLSKKGDHHRTGGTSLDSLDIPWDKKCILVIAQVAGDASLVLDSPHYWTSADLVQHVAKLAETHPDWHIIVRLHPKEAWHRKTGGGSEGPGEYLWDTTLLELERSGTTKLRHVTVVSGPGVNTYDLMCRCQVGVTINSQAGLEMVLLGKPVVTTGNSLYSHNGFTWDIARPELLESSIEGALALGLTGSEILRLYSFCRYLFGHYLIPFDPVKAAVKNKRLHEVLGVTRYAREQ